MSMAEFKGKVKNIQDTPFGYTVSLIGGKWKMVIIYLLAENRTVRFNDLKRQIGAITYKTLSSQLKELEADGLVNRKEYPQIPLKSSTVSQIKQKHYYLFWKGYVSGEQKTKIVKSSFLIKKPICEKYAEDAVFFILQRKRQHTAVQQILLY